jgi:hypothetical protein
VPGAPTRFVVATCVLVCLLAPIAVATVVSLAARGYVIRNADGSNVGLLYDGALALRIKGYGPDIDGDAVAVPLNAIVLFAVPPFAWCHRFRAQKPTSRADARLLAASSVAVCAMAVALLLLNLTWAVTCFFPVAVLAWLVVGVAAAARRYQSPAERRRAYRLAHNLCLNCGYDLRGTPARCPECGTDARVRSAVTPSR